MISWSMMTSRPNWDFRTYSDQLCIWLCPITFGTTYIV